MNILMISNDYPPILGGIATHVKSLSEALAKPDNDVHVVVPTPGLPQKLQTEKINSVSIHRWGFKYSSSPLLRAFRIGRAALNAYATISQNLSPHFFDIVHQQDVRATKYAASKIASRHDIPLIWTYHSPQLWTNKDWKHHLFLKSIHFKPDGIITVSRELYRQAERNWGDRDVKPEIAFIPNGVNFQLFDSNIEPYNPKPGYIKQSDFVVFCPSRFVEKKGIRYLAEAVSTILRTASDIPLKVIFFKDSDYAQYEASYFNEIRQMLAPWEDKHIFYLDYIPLDKMPGLYALADTVVLPSLKEAVNLSMLEAMALKKPVIASRVGGLAETITHKKNGWLVPPGDSEALKKAIIEVFQNTETRSEVAEQGYQLVKDNYSWNHIAEQTLDFYRQVLKKA